MRFKDWLEVYRIDPEQIPDFSKDMKTYFRSPDFFSSGTFTNDKLPVEFKTWKSMGKGLFAGQNLKDVIPYAIPRDVPWVLASPNTKRPILYLAKTDQSLIKKYNPWITKLEPSSFVKLPSGELFSQSPQVLGKQEKIRNVMKFIKQWMDIKFVDDLQQIIVELKHHNIQFWSEGI